jgi:hypothetical protein
MQRVLALPGRTVYHLPGSSPAVFYLVLDGVGGIFVNLPPFDEALRAGLQALAAPRLIFLPSHFGAHDLARWREALAVPAAAYGDEGRHVAGGVDIVLDRGWRVTREVDFLPLSGRTRGCCALRVKRRPAIVFVGPALDRQSSGWPGITAHPDDDSFENRLLGAVGLRQLKFDHVFTDDFDPALSRTGPGAAAAVRELLDAALA